MADTVQVVTVEEVRDRMSLQDLQDINDAIVSGLSAANTFFEGALGTKFVPVQNQTDVFYIDSNMMDPQAGMWRLCLKRMFLYGTPTIKYATSRVDLASGDTVPDTDCVIDLEKGLVLLEAGSDTGRLLTSKAGYDDTYVSVTYNAGIDKDHVAPAWLKEAVLAYMPSILLTEGDLSQAQRLDQIANIRRLSVDMVEPYKRSTALQFAPLY